VFDFSQLPVSGSFILACGLYVGASLYGGQVVGSRTIEHSEWPKTCAAGVKADIDARKRPDRVLPKTDCHSVFGWLHPDIGRACAQYGNPDLGGPAAKATREAERRRREFEERRLARAASKADSRCGCAACKAFEETKR
jgi:hypothetical protein